MGLKMPRVVVFWTTSTMKDEKSAAKFHYIKTVSGRVVAQSIAFRVVSIFDLCLQTVFSTINETNSQRWQIQFQMAEAWGRKHAKPFHYQSEY